MPGLRRDLTPLLRLRMFRRELDVGEGLDLLRVGHRAVRGRVITAAQEPLPSQAVTSSDTSEN